MIEKTRSLSAFGVASEDQEFPFPEGHRVSFALHQELVNLPESLHLGKDFVYTFWATKISDGSWEELTAQENLRLYPISPEKIQEAQAQLFGEPLPYLGMILKELPTASVMEQTFAGSDYEPISTHAMYLQKDMRPVPDFRYFVWLARRPLGEKSSKRIAKVASALQGTLVLPFRLSHSTDNRETPAMTFHSALNTRLTPTSGVGEESSSMVIPEMTVEGKAPPTWNWVTYSMIAVGFAAVAAVGYSLVDRRKT